MFGKYVVFVQSKQKYLQELECGKDLLHLNVHSAMRIDIRGMHEIQTTTT